MFVQATGTWLIKEITGACIEVQVPDEGGKPHSAALSQLNTFLENQEVLATRCRDYLEHHLKFEGTARLAAIEAFVQPNCHGATLIVVYFTEADRYMWLEVGLSPHPAQGFWPAYALVKYY